MGQHGRDVSVRHPGSLYVGGRWVAPGSSETIDVVDPTTEQVIAAVPAATAADVDAAVSAARAAFGGWSATGPGERAKYLAGLADALKARQEEIARTISTEMGAPTKLALAVQTGLPHSVLTSYAEMLPDFAFEETIGNSLVVPNRSGSWRRSPRGTTRCTRPSRRSRPRSPPAARVVLKPSEIAPLASTCSRRAGRGPGCPPGVLNLVTGTGPEVGEALAAHPDVDMVSFTGSTRAGRRVSGLRPGRSSGSPSSSAASRPT